MGMNDHGPLAQVSDLILAAIPVDLSAAAVNGEWANFKTCEGLNMVLLSAKGTADQDPVISLEQAKDAAGTGAKTLQIKDLHYKIGSPDIEAADDLWQRVDSIDRDNPADSYDSAAIDGAENALVLAVYVLPQDLDVANGFTHARLNCADVGAAAQLGAMIYIPAGRAYRGGHNTSLLA